MKGGGGGWVGKNRSRWAERPAPPPLWLVALDRWVDDVIINIPRNPTHESGLKSNTKPRRYGENSVADETFGTEGILSIYLTWYVPYPVYSSTCFFLAFFVARINPTVLVGGVNDIEVIDPRWGRGEIKK